MPYRADHLTTEEIEIVIELIDEDILKEALEYVSDGKGTEQDFIRNVLVPRWKTQEKLDQTVPIPEGLDFNE